ncbi:MAG: hypothetical protein KDI48_18615, partial [Xanthomonadales bacterium]|nr:hypothetical protein [Xanthomonadales bacterium]
MSGLPGRREILGNRYRGNRGAGIDTTNAGSGRRPNDAGDSDSATRSKLQNFPVISAFRRNGDAIEVDYLVDSSFAAVPGAGQSTYPLRIEFYAADGAAGAELLGVDSYPSSSAQQLRTASFSLPAGVSLAADAVIVATATDSPPVVGEPVVSATGHTSEFSFYPLESFQLLPLEPALIGVPYAVRVRAVAAPGVPFKPQGEALVIDGRGGSCTVQITPVAADRTGEGECLLTTNGAPGNINVSASYSATLNAFATAAGSSPPVSTSSQSLGSLLTVDTTSDNGGLSACTTAPADCSLRGAIIASNGLAGADTIEFNIPTSDPGCSAVTGICRIVVAADLPSVMGPVSINGYSQPGAQPNTLPAPGANNAQLKVEITGAAGFTSFRLFSLSGTAAPFEMSGLAIFMPSNGGIVSGGLRHVIRGNWFGVTASGGIPDYTVAGSVFDLGGFNRSIVIGGPDPADRNVIAGSGRDMSTPALPGGGQNTIRVNSINSERGRILFQGNLVGLAPDGITPLPFTTFLVVNPGDDVFATPDVEILDNRMARAPRNFGCTCGGNLRLSINRNMLDPTLGRTTLVQRNVFGIGVDGSFIDGTSDHVDIDLGNPSRTANIRVGGLGLDEGNVFARALPLSTFNLGSAVAIPNGSTANTQIEVVGNRMLGNAGLGVDLRGETIPALGRTINDAGDP